MALPLLNEPLITKARLSVWARRPIETDLDRKFADEVIGAVSTLVRTYGDPAWSIEVEPAFLHERADSIAMTTAKNYFINPKGQIADTVGPLTERYIEAVVNNISLTEEQKLELARAAGRDDGEAGSGTGLWVLSADTSYSQPIRNREPRYWP